jgi:hypothetical protein
VRGPSSKSLLKLAWSYPVYMPPEEFATEGQTQAKAVRRALPAADAFAVLAGDDPRPLLVLRECFVCNGTDDALLSKGVDNEKTFLFSRWFNCVKLPPDVLEDDHPFRNLFPGGTSEHLFMASRDGSLRIPLESERSRAELWDSMLKVLTADYRSDPTRSVKDIQRVLDRLDRADLRVAELQTRVDELLETDGPDSPKLAKLQKQLAAAHAEREDLLSRVSKASELQLKEHAAKGNCTVPGAG